MSFYTATSRWLHHKHKSHLSALKLIPFLPHLSILVKSEINEKSSCWWNWSFTPPTLYRIKSMFDKNRLLTENFRALMKEKKHQKNHFIIFERKQRRKAFNKHKMDSYVKNVARYSATYLQKIEHSAFYVSFFQDNRWKTANNREQRHKKQAMKALWLNFMTEEVLVVKNWFSCSLSTQRDGESGIITEEKIKRKKDANFQFTTHNIHFKSFRRWNT